MTSKQLFEGLLIELSKVNAPSMLLLDFNYFANKTVQQYINKRYNVYDTSLQTTDDLRVLKSSAILTANKVNDYGELSDYSTGIAKLFGNYYEVELPDDYVHMLNCVCIYQIEGGNFKCYDDGDYVLFAAKRLTADSWSLIMNDFYNRPLPERPYYYIHNVNTQEELPTNPYNDGKGTDQTSEQEYPRAIRLKIGDQTTNVSRVDRPAYLRAPNPTKVRCEIRYGKDDTVFKLKNVAIDYIKAPQIIRLTLEQLDTTRDTSLILEFPDYVCQEILNELALLVMENTADPRLLTHAAVTQSIATPNVLPSK